MIAFGSSMTSPEIYGTHARVGVERAAEPDSEIFAIQAAGSISRSYNLIMERARACPGLEALVLIHQDAEITDPDFCAKVRAVVGEPLFGVAGVAGIVGAPNISWWEGRLAWSSLTYSYGESGGGELPGIRWGGASASQSGPPEEVETLDGVVLILSPWALENLRFDESFSLLYGYDFDFCQQVRAAGRRVIATDIEVTHHHSLDLIVENEPWVAAHMRVAEKWDGRIPGSHPQPEGEWKQRARRAEAEAAVARLQVNSRQLQGHAATRELEDRLGEVIFSRSWRLTEPLRRFILQLKERRAAARSG